MDEVGYLSLGALNHVARTLSVPPADVYGVATFYAMFATEPRAPYVVHVCDDVACGPCGGEEIVARLTDELGPEGEGKEALLGAQPVPGPVRARARRAAAARRPARREPRARATADVRRRCAAVAARWPRPRRRRPTLRDRRARRRPRGRGLRPRPTGRSPTARSAPRRPPTGRLPAAGPGRRRRPGEPRRLPRPRRLRGAAPRDPARPVPGDQRGHRLRAHRARRRGVPHRHQVVRGGHGPAAAALPGLQRRRVRARHVQGPGADGARPVRPDRGDDDRRVRHRLRTRLPLHPRRVPARHAQAAARHRRRAGPRPPRRPTSWARASRSTSSCAAARAPTSAARRPRCSTRSRASAASRATSRRSRASAACSGGPQ